MKAKIVKSNSINAAKALATGSTSADLMSSSDWSTSTATSC